MSKHSAASAPTHAAPSISLLLTNLHLLDLDSRDDWPSITAQTFTSKNTLQNEKARIQCVEWAFYRLFEIWDPVETKDKLGPFFPAFVPLQSLNLRAALFRCLNELKKNAILGKDVIVRKTFFDDCKGERIQELLVSFSTLVLRKVLAAGLGGKACIAARLATAKALTAKDQRSFLPLAVAHRASLTALLHKKKDLREKYKDFGRTLDAKERELNQRFEAAVSTQDLLDKNPMPDHKVARVSKLFEKNWQGDRRPLEVIAQGEEQGVEDSLLDRPFSETWLQISAGTFDGATGTSWQGLLQDLDKRVATQEARLTDWKNFREAMKRDDKAISAARDTSSTLIQIRDKNSHDQRQRDFVFSPRKSPRKSDWEVGERKNETSPTHPMRLRKENTQDELKERDPVFSPRKSPLKSMLPVEDPGADTSPAYSRAASKQKETESVATRNGDLGGITKSPVRGNLRDYQEGDTANSSSHVSSMDNTDESGFSEISDGQLQLSEPSDHTVRIDHLDSTQHLDQNGASSTPNNKKDEPQKLENRFSDIPRPSDHPHTLSTKNSDPATLDDDDSWISSLPVEDKQEDIIESESPNEDDILAEQIVSMTINAVPTPAKSKVSLIERTRQSMALASPVGLQSLLPEGPPSTPLPPIASKTSHPTTDPSGPTTLLERTRQSISLVPSIPKGSRKSMLDRRTSKPYPTNQFETPKRQLERVTELTPPEELFSPGAGYDSVFKSRPKIAYSPNPSPKPGDDPETDAAEGERNGNGRVRKGQRDASPLARMTTKV
ncbi:hypothetical protein HO173_000717 [Letharia columbiana]|uniref:HAUS augmin-like complex subunit 6 N-terminal domain-containing protein n=1 Tax=Letharia columbiana TaxID=112416 RepID=A0A8H6G5C8_9LECA|nr:uncharacterized protein HO173_000717 [Letharia columbiana]KAF6240925.1 hypothetical protein HO173_000717 [Letharia columbiana]